MVVYSVYHHTHDAHDTHNMRIVISKNGKEQRVGGAMSGAERQIYKQRSHEEEEGKEVDHRGDDVVSSSKDQLAAADKTLLAHGFRNQDSFSSHMWAMLIIVRTGAAFPRMRQVSMGSRVQFDRGYRS